MRNLLIVLLIFPFSCTRKGQIHQSFEGDGIEEIKVNDEIYNRPQWHPSIEASKDKIVVVFEDNRKGEWRIFGQIYSGNMEKQGKNFLVDESPRGMQLTPDVDMWENGDFVVVWEDSRYGNWDVIYRIFDGEGHPKGESKTVTRSPYAQGNPVVSIIDSEKFVIVWVDGRENHWHIRGRIFRKDGIALKGEIVFVTLEEGYALSPTVISDGEGFYVAWVEKVKGESKIYYSYYSGDGNLIIHREPVEKGGEQYSPQFSHSHDSIFLIWIEKEGVWGRIKGSKLNGEVVTLTDKFHHLLNPTGCVKDTLLFLVWSDYRYKNYDIFGAFYSFKEKSTKEIFRINDDMGKRTQWQPDVTFIDDKFIVVWSDHRGMRSDIYLETIKPVNLQYPPHRQPE
jgi:hypothetical protein